MFNANLRPRAQPSICNESAGSAGGACTAGWPINMDMAPQGSLMSSILHSKVNTIDILVSTYGDCPTPPSYKFNI